MNTQKEYNVGDKVWINYMGLIVQCTITFVEDCFRKKHPEAYLFYGVDEPIGHDLGADELFDSPEAVIKAKGCISDGPFIKPTLDSHREASMRFILSTHQEGIDYQKVDKVPSSDPS